MFNDVKYFFKYLVAKIKSKRFSAKALSFILVATVILLIPALTAIWHVYFRTTDDFESSSDITVSLFDINQNKELFSEEINEKNIADSHIANMFFNINSGKELSSVPPQAPSEPNFKIQIKSKNDSIQYLCYFSEASSNSYISDENKRIYSVNEKNYTSFLTSIYSTSAYSHSVPPTLLTESGVKITPKSVNWHFKKSNGIFEMPVGISTTDSNKLYHMHEEIALSFSTQPSKCKITVYEISENTPDRSEIYSGDLSGLSSITIDSEAKLLFLVDASWFQSDYNEFYGDISYSFEVNCTEHASFVISSSTVSPGEFITVTLRGITDPSNVTYEAFQSDEIQNNILSPAKKEELTNLQKEAIDFLKSFDPSFASDGQNLYAFFPIPIDTPNGVLSFSLSSGIVAKTFSVEITEKSRGKLIDLSATSENITDIISKDAIEEAKAALSASVSTQAQTLLFHSDFAQPLKDHDSALYEFCDTFALNDTLIDGLRSYGNFYVSNDDSFLKVSPISIGKVAYVGYAKQLGNFVVIDHGMGLCSWYCNLAFVDVRQGDVVAKDQFIGTTGNSPLMEENGVLLICTIQNSIIDPALIINRQITLEN